MGWRWQNGRLEAAGGYETTVGELKESSGENIMNGAPEGSGGTMRLKGVAGGAGTDDRIKGPWSPEEDVVLNRLVEKFGARNWSLIARGIPGRSGKSCRLRWCNQLNPGVKRKPFTGCCCCCCYFSFFLSP